MNSPKIRLEFAALAVAAIFSLHIAGGIALSQSPAETRLKDAGIEANRDGIAKYLSSLLPDKKAKQKSAALIAKLGDADFRVRDDATRQLAALGTPPIEQLRVAAESKDSEVRYRVRILLRRIERGDFLTLQLAVLETVHRRKIKGLAPLLLKLFPRWSEPHQFRVASRALSATATENDLPELKTTINEHAVRKVRIAAVAALAAVSGKKSLGDMVKLLEDRDDGVRLEAAVALARFKDRRCLPVLLKLLESATLDVRIRAASILRAVTSQRFGYVAYGKSERRAEAVKRWAKWVGGHQATAKLKVPGSRVAVETGRTVYAVWSQKKIIEIDSKGRQVFEAGGYSYIWGCQGLPNGHRLAVDMSRKLVIEYDARGKEIWRRSNLPAGPTSVERLENGRTLLALPNAGQVVEVDQKGEIVWKISLQGRPTSAQRLPNGLTVVNLQFGKKVVDVDRNGNTVRTLLGPTNALTAQRLPNGNTLVCDMGKRAVFEYDRNGHVVWSKTGLNNPAQAQRIANGNTLVSDNNGLHEFDPQGKEVWHFRTTRGKFHRF